MTRLRYVFYIAIILCAIIVSGCADNKPVENQIRVNIDGQKVDYSINETDISNMTMDEIMDPNRPLTHH